MHEKLVLSKNPENKNPESKNQESKNQEKFIRNLFIIEDTRPVTDQAHKFSSFDRKNC